jgi:lipoyl(octanoyl) transferase
VSFHGIALNVSPDLSHYAGIVPCGIREYGVTSLADLGVKTTMEDVDHALRRQFEAVFGPTFDTQTVGRTAKRVSSGPA